MVCLWKREQGMGNVKGAKRRWAAWKRDVHFETKNRLAEGCDSEERVVRVGVKC